MFPLLRPIRSLLRSFGVDVMTTERRARLERTADAHEAILAKIGLLKAIDPVSIPPLLDLLPESRSQFGQDLFALIELGFPRGGFFVEFGATDGVELSNTLLLETAFGWTGILAEPARTWHADLARNRSCRIVHECVWRESGATLTFAEAPAAGLSTIAGFVGADEHRGARRDAVEYEVRTISLMDLLASQGAPRRIDFLSIDTEGSELEILQAFDFDAYDIRIIVCEHNHTEARAPIARLLERHGYRRKYMELSGVDDWFVRD